MLKQHSIDEIKSQLIKSCLTNNPASFIPYLLSKNVSVNTTTKLKFYQFFKYMTQGNMGCFERKYNFKIENYKIENDCTNYEVRFYDDYRSFPRVTVEIKETKNKIIIDVSPF